MHSNCKSSQTQRRNELSTTSKMSMVFFIHFSLGLCSRVSALTQHENYVKFMLLLIKTNYSVCIPYSHDAKICVHLAPIQSVSCMLNLLCCLYLQIDRVHRISVPLALWNCSVPIHTHTHSRTQAQIEKFGK